MAYDKNFLGKNGFFWFNGVVEDRNDPLKAGRYKVRCLGYHTDNKEVLPTSDLPWSLCVLSLDSPGISGLGTSPAFLVEGSWVYGYFRDGEECQEPVILGVLPGIPSEYGKPSGGFNDPTPREDNNEISNYPREINEPDTNRLAVNNEDKIHASLQARREARVTGIPTADFDAVNQAAGSAGDTWNEPQDTYNTVYPYNKVTEYESGHIVEFDDTKDNERIHIRHKTGTSTELLPNGDKVTLVKGSDYTITTDKRQAFIQGDCDLTVDGRSKIYINKSGVSGNHYDIQVGPGASVNIQVDNGDVNVVTKTGNMNMEVGNDMNINVGGNLNLDVRGNKSETINGSKTSSTKGNVQHRGARIDLN